MLPSATFQIRLAADANSIINSVSNTLELIRNGIGLLIVAVLLYYFARVAVWIGDAFTARLLAPLAPLIAAVPNSRQAYLLGTYLGYKVRFTITPGQSVGSGDASSSINAFHVEVLDVPGKKDWWLQFHVSGMFGQGPKQLGIGARDTALAERLQQSNVVKEVEAVSSPTDIYITVSYEAFRKSLTYTDDVSPRKVPTAEVVPRYLALAVRLAELNARINPL